MKKYRKDFLTKPRLLFGKKHKEWIWKSRFQFDIDWKTKKFSLSILGFINGLLPILPGHPVLVAEVENKREILRYYIKRRWW